MRGTFTEMLEAMDDIQADCERLRGQVAEVWDAIKHGSYNKVCYISQDIEKIAYALKLEAFDMKLAAKEIEEKAKGIINDEQQAKR